MSSNYSKTASVVSVEKILRQESCVTYLRFLKYFNDYLNI